MNLERYFKKLSMKKIYAEPILFPSSPSLNEEQSPVVPVPPEQVSPLVQPVPPTTIPSATEQVIETKFNPWKKRGRILGYYFNVIGVKPDTELGELLKAAGYVHGARHSSFSKKVDSDNYSLIKGELLEIGNATGVVFSEEAFEVMDNAFNIDSIIEQTGKDKKVEEIVDDVLANPDIDNNHKKQITNKFIREKIEELGNLTDEASKQEIIQKFLTMGKNFHKYSFVNYILMLLQNPNVSSQVAGKKQWENPNGKYKRKIKEDEKPMDIFAPARYRIYLKDAQGIVDKLRSQGNRYSFDIKRPGLQDLVKMFKFNRFQSNYLGFMMAIGASGIKDIISRIERDIAKPNHQYYKTIYYGKVKNGWNMAQVYDISQTESTGPDSFEKPEIKWQAENAPDEAVSPLVDGILGYASVAKWQHGDKWENGISINLEEGMKEGLGGWSKGSEIAINNMSVAWRQFSTLVHEIAHSLLHFGPSRGEISGQQREIEAESTSYIVLNYFGYNAPEFCANYLALKSATRGDILDRYDKIDYAARGIVNGIEKAIGGRSKKSNWFTRIKLAESIRGDMVDDLDFIFLK